MSGAQAKKNKYVRKARQYCEVCRTWIQSDPKSIQLHESAGRHKFNLRKSASDAEKRNLAAKREQAHLEKELAAINRAALKATGQKTNESGLDHGKESSFDAKEEGGLLDLDVEEPTKDNWQVFEDSALGQYAVDGKIYLEGNLHEDILTIGRVCESVCLEPFVDEEDGEEGEEEVWRPCVIVSVKEEMDVEKHELVRKFDVRFIKEETGPSQPPHLNSQSRSVHSLEIKTVTSRDIRVVAPGPPPPTQLELIQKEESLKGPETNGGWTTVAIRHVVSNEQVDEQVADQNKVQVKEEPAKVGKPRSTISSQLAQNLATQEAQGDDALATFNPFGGAYKGVQIGESSAVEQARLNIEQEESVPSSTFGIAAEPAGPVKFKKKKKRARPNSNG